MNAWANYACALEALDLAAKVAMRKNKPRKKTGHKGSEARNRGDPELTRFVANLGEIYKDVWERSPGVSRPPHAQNDRQPGGPFIRFVEVCLRALGINKSTEAIVHIWKARSDLIKS
jgi:hypothetical protein